MLSECRSHLFPCHAIHDTPELGQRMREGFAVAATEPEPYLLL